MKQKYFVKKGMQFLSILLILILSSCVSHKKKGEVSKAGKFYHNTTALYNGYFNARELMVASVEKLQNQQADNYNDILSIYPESEVDKPEAVAEDLNKAIEKVSIVATLHEPSMWVDDCYIIIGKAQYLQQNYETAQETFEYFLEEFDPLNTRRKKRKKDKKKKKTSKKKKSSKKKNAKPGSKKKKKKPGSKKKKKKKKSSSKKKKVTKETPEQKEARIKREEEDKKEAAIAQKKKDESIEIDRGNNGLFKHQNAFPEGLLWLSRTYVEREKYNLVDFYLNKILEQAEVPKEILKEVPVVRAYSALDQLKYGEAIEHLGEAIPLEKKKLRKARLIFIQAQLYQKMNMKAEAFAGFNKVIKMKPDFLMEFNAALNMLKSSMASGAETYASVEKMLEKMLKEEKNTKFKDQIYFTLGEINFEQNNLKKAIPNFRQAIQHNVDNNAQLVESYYVLATIFYDAEDYVLSKAYYDSTSTVISKSDDRYFKVQAFSENLTDIAKNIQIISLQDSLLRLAELTPEELVEIARKLKKDKLLAEAKAAKDKNVDDPITNVRNVKIGPGSKLGSRTSTLWCYNDTKVEAGKRDFLRTWGYRNLEDDWRRSSKSSDIANIEDISDDDDVDISEEEVEELLKDIPRTPDQKTQAKSKIRTALFELGVLYRDKIANYTKSIETLKSLQTRFPGSEKEPDALYYLYLSHLDIEDQPQAQYYLNQMKTKYPEEKYTLAITDPNYMDKILAESKIQETMYNEAYIEFTTGNFKKVLSMQKSALDKFSADNTYGSKYALIAAMSTGKIEGREKYIGALKNMIATYPNTPEQTRAKEILRFLKGDEEAFININETEAVEDFEEDDDKLHYVIVVVYSKKDSDLNAAKISVSNYNKKYHKVERLKISSSTLHKENNTQVVLLRKFGDKKTAMKYYKEVKRNKKEFIEIKLNYDVFAITQRNFREIMKKKSVKEYEVFFTEKYM